MSIKDSSVKVFNEFDYEQKGDSKRVKARFTNDVGTVFAEALASVIGNGTVIRNAKNPFHRQSLPKDSPVSTTTKVSLSSAGVEDAEIIDDSLLQEGLAKVFAFQNDKMSLINPRLKQTGKLDNAIRLALLVLYAYEIAGFSEIERTVLNEVLASSKLEDGNFRSWLGKCDEVINSGNKLKLSVPGKEVAREILKEVLDDSITKGVVRFSKVSKGVKRKRSDNSDETSSNGGSGLRKKKGPVYYLDELSKEGFFSTKRKISDIIEHLKVNKAETYSTNELSTPLKRMIKAGRLKREKNSESQYEYFT